jgi:malonyl-CoA/methylmalonyl-CoA synthetase
MAGTLPKLPLFEALVSHDAESLVVIHSASGRRFTYGGLVSDVTQAGDDLRRHAGNRKLDGERIAFLVENGYDYVGAKCQALMFEIPIAHLY